MARLLYRLGRFSARRAKTTLAAWLGILLLAAAAFLGLGGQLTGEISLPGLETEKVADRIAEELPDSSGDTANAIARTTDGSAFTPAQRANLERLVDELSDVEGVDSVVDPFATEADIAKGQTDIADGLSKLDAGEEQVTEGRAQLDAARDQLAAAQEQLDSAVEQARADGTYEFAVNALDAQQSQLDAAADEVAANQTQLDDSAQELADGRAELTRNETLLNLSVGAPFVSESGDAAIFTLMFDADLGEGGIPGDEITEILEAADIDGVEVLPGAGLTFEMPEMFSTAELIGIAVAAAVLLIMLGTLIGAGLPLLNAMVGVGIGVLTTMALSSVVDIVSITPVLGLMLGLAVGIDYALFILHRHRTQLKSGMSVGDSIPLANGTSGNAVVFAGATVIIALLALNVTGLPFLGMMGTVGALCVLIAVLLAVTMTPALLSLVGPKILNKKERARLASGSTTSGASAPIAATPIKTTRAVGVVLLSVVGLGVLSIPTLDLRLGLPAASAQAEDSAAYQSYAAMEDSFGPGRNGPLVVVADFPAGLTTEEAQDRQIDIALELQKHPDIASVLPAALNEDNSVAILQVIPKEGPTAESTEALVHEFRDGDPLSGSGIEQTSLSVAGQTAADIDISDMISDALPLYLVLVIGLSLLLMVMVFRSVLLPVIATVGFIGSFAAAVGVVVAVFQWGWFGDLFAFGEPGPVLTFLPIIMVGVLFGLAMDYQLFTASGMREAYVHGAPPRVAVRQGLRAGRTVVTAAALIMAAVFAGFVMTPDPMIASMGLGLAVGVVLDAFVVRLLLVPALLHLCGPAAWWLPKWLDRILPDVDVEGSVLERPDTAQVTPDDEDAERAPRELVRR